VGSQSAFKKHYSDTISGKDAGKNQHTHASIIAYLKNTVNRKPKAPAILFRVDIHGFDFPASMFVSVSTDTPAFFARAPRLKP